MPSTNSVQTTDKKIQTTKTTATPTKAPETSDAELLKQKKLAAKTAKQRQKTERVQAKIARQKIGGKTTATKKQVIKRNPLKIHSKAWRQAKAKITPKKLYAAADALKLALETSTTKFDASVEIHLRLLINPKKSDQAMRATVNLPAGTGKKLRVIAFVPEAQVDAAKKAGAVAAGEDDLIAKIAKGFLDFDVAIATPELMKKIAKIAKILGQKGLMPNPKAGTVTPDFAAAIQAVQKGKIEFRNDKFGILHNLIGKVSFGPEKLLENLQAYCAAVKAAKPKTVKGALIASMTLTTSMGPGIPVDPKSVTEK